MPIFYPDIEPKYTKAKLSLPFLLPPTQIPLSSPRTHTRNKMPRILLIFILFIPFLIRAQVDSIGQPDRTATIVEDFLQNSDEEGDFDFNTLFEDLEYYLENPLNINEATQEELYNLQLLSDIQIIELLKHRRETGDLIALFELQSIPSFDLATIRGILPYVAVKGSVDDYQLSIPKMMAEGKNELYMRWSRIAEEQRGYQDLEGSRYLGSPDQLYVRYRHSYSNKLSYGFTAEKDRGEEFFQGSNEQGFDYYSAHFFLQNYNRTIKAVALGDYAVSFGQGLILYSGFGYGKSSLVMNVKRTAPTLRKYTSVNEAIFFRGAATTLAFGDHLEVTALASFRNRDANLLEPDTLQIDEIPREVTSLDIDGLHRTESEIEDKNAIGQQSFGGQIKWKGDRGHIALNGLYEQLDASLTPFRPQPYNIFNLTGDRVYNASLDYSYIFQNFNFFGETAIADNGAIATINGLLMGLDRRVDFSMVFRHYPRDYRALNANPFGEVRGGNNETGLYLGLELRPMKHWKLAAYFDTWRHPWLRFNVDAPSRGYEYRGRITYYLKRDLEVYAEVRNEIKDINVDKIDGNNNFTVPRQTFQARLHVAKKASKTIELRSRLDIGFTDNEINNRQSGFSVYQDLIYKPISIPFSFTTRFAIFDTDGYQVRFYSFENNLLYTFAIPAYYNRGTRFYFNLRYKGIRNLTLEARFAQTYWANQESIGSGLDEVEGPVRTELGAQIRYRF